jgi:hypothetical protein
VELEAGLCVAYATGTTVGGAGALADCSVDEKWLWVGCAFALL